jgi:phosphate transport system substrate-binding protein
MNCAPTVNLLRRWIVALCCLVLAACQPTEAPPATPVPTERRATLRVGASSSAMPLLDLVVPAYMLQAPHVTISRESGNSALMLEAVMMGRDNIAVVALPPPEGVWYLPVAVTGIAMIVHPSNPLRELTLLQTRDLFRGEIYSWAQLGGRSDNVLVLSREDGSGMRQVFESSVMGEQRVTLTAAIMPSDDAAIETVASTPGAIGYASFASVGTAVKVLPLEGVAPSPRSLADGSYPLTTPLYFVSRDEPGGEARAFVQFLLSSEGQVLIGEKYGRVK